MSVLKNVFNETTGHAKRLQFDTPILMYADMQQLINSLPDFLSSPELQPLLKDVDVLRKEIHALWIGLGHNQEPIEMGMDGPKSNSEDVPGDDHHKAADGSGDAPDNQEENIENSYQRDLISLKKSIEQQNLWKMLKLSAK